MLLQLNTWTEVEEYLDKSTTILMPIGSTEQHGPNGLIGTDAMTAEYIATAVGERTSLMVAPTISVGMAQHHMAFTGSMTLKPTTLLLVIKDYVEGLARHGFDRFYFINGHGGNISTINSAFQEIYSSRPIGEELLSNRSTIKCRLRSWWQGPKVAALIKKEFGEKDGMHATISEISVIQYLFPKHIKYAAQMGPPSENRGPWSDADDYRAKFPDGRIGSHPYLASPEAGARLFEAAVEEIASEAEFFSED